MACRRLQHNTARREVHGKRYGDRRGLSGLNHLGISHIGTHRGDRQEIEGVRKITTKNGLTGEIIAAADRVNGAVGDSAGIRRPY